MVRLNIALSTFRLASVTVLHDHIGVRLVAGAKGVILIYSPLSNQLWPVATRQLVSQCEKDMLDYT
jgi:hypothetical protein